MKRLLTSVALSAVFAGSALAGSHGGLKFPVGEGDQFNWDSYNAFAGAHDYSGQELTIFGPWVGVDQELVESVLAYFSEATGATVKYTGSDSFEKEVVVNAQAGTASNIAVFPQPGLAADLAAQGLLTPLKENVGKWLAENYGAGQSWVDLGSYKGKDGASAHYAFPYKADVKSLVWYSPDNFAEAGYEVPTTMEDLIALSDKIVADGGTPWCIGIGSEGATGWPATDWVEDMMLRTQSPDVYDQWVTNEIAFNDPRVIEAIEAFGKFVFTEGYANGGSAGVGGTDFRDSPKGLFEAPAKCYMHRQASFIPSFFPEGTELGTDADFFYFPPYSGKDLGKPVLGGGTLFAITKDSEAAHGFIEFLETPIAHEIWMAQSGFLTPHKGVNANAYANDALKAQGEILAGATTFRFDGSDLMPGAIGAGAFWSGMIDYVDGKSAADVAGEIDKAYKELD